MITHAASPKTLYCFIEPPHAVLFYQNNPDQSTLYFCSATATRRKYSALML